MAKEKDLKLVMRLEDWEEVAEETEIKMREAFCKMTLAKILYSEAITQIKRLGGKTHAERQREWRRKYSQFANAEAI